MSLNIRVFCQLNGTTHDSSVSGVELSPTSLRNPFLLAKTRIPKASPVHAQATSCSSEVDIERCSLAAGTASRKQAIGRDLWRIHEQAVTRLTPNAPGSVPACW